MKTSIHRTNVSSLIVLSYHHRKVSDMVLYLSKLKSLDVIELRVSKLNPLAILKEICEHVVGLSELDVVWVSGNTEIKIPVAPLI